MIVTHYPGASAQQVEEEVTLPLENAIQQLPSLDNVSSISSNGLSQITVNIASQYHSSELPQIWDELRRRVGDASRLFPPGVVTPSSMTTLAMCLAFLRHLGRQFYQPRTGALCRTAASGAGAGSWGR